MFSMLTTTAYVLRTCSISLAKSTAITPALQPIPPRLNVLIFPRSLYLLTIMELNDGVGLNRLQFTTKIPISFGLTLVDLNRLSRAPNITSSASFLAAAIEGTGGMLCRASGRYVSSPRPDLSKIFL
ncbi:hypothetical protein HanPSC8_Chr03g0106421 [Helianthus annuus]|nr:hypothetical protein HanHA89_Chr03g0103461 [Helianthus annuus]KAJ0943580.1 hypothetical protein HanPSC8_Chr03g0106421 [Helianthus annuus]